MPPLQPKPCAPPDTWAAAPPLGARSHRPTWAFAEHHSLAELDGCRYWTSDSSSATQPRRGQRPSAKPAMGRLEPNEGVFPARRRRLAAVIGEGEGRLQLAASPSRDHGAR